MITAFDEIRYAKRRLTVILISFPISSVYDSTGSKSISNYTQRTSLAKRTEGAQILLLIRSRHYFS